MRADTVRATIAWMLAINFVSTAGVLIYVMITGGIITSTSANEVPGVLAAVGPLFAIYMPTVIKNLLRKPSQKEALFKTNGAILSFFVIFVYSISVPGIIVLRAYNKIDHGNMPIIIGIVQTLFALYIGDMTRIAFSVKDGDSEK